MANYTPTPPPFKSEQLVEYLERELKRIASAGRDDSETVHYMNRASAESLSAAISANWKCSNANILRLSTSNTVTLTGLAHVEANRVRHIVNVGSGVVVLKSEGAESSASHRFLLPASAWQLSANGAAVIWYDPISARHRGLSRT